MTDDAKAPLTENEKDTSPVLEEETPALLPETSEDLPPEDDYQYEEEFDIDSLEEQKVRYLLVFKQHVTLMLIATVAVIALVAIIAAAAVPASANAIKDIVTSVAPQMIAIVSLVVGYFFGRNRR